MTELIERIEYPEGKNFWFSARSASRGEGKWSNCLYLHFAKEDFPQIESPPLVDCDWYGRKQKRFEYGKSILNDIDFHGGISFYEETFVVESGRTIVKIGCDYQHYMDDEWERSDCGKELLQIDAKDIMSQFEKIILDLEAKP